MYWSIERVYNIGRCQNNYYHFRFRPLLHHCCSLKNTCRSVFGATAEVTEATPKPLFPPRVVWGSSPRHSRSGSSIRITLTPELATKGKGCSPSSKNSKISTVDTLCCMFYSRARDRVWLSLEYNFLVSHLFPWLCCGCTYWLIASWTRSVELWPMYI